MKSLPEFEEAHNFTIVMAFDAFRLALGKEPEHHTQAEVIRWIETIQAEKQAETSETPPVNPKHDAECHICKRPLLGKGLWFCSAWHDKGHEEPRPPAGETANIPKSDSVTARASKGEPKGRRVQGRAFDDPIHGWTFVPCDNLQAQDKRATLIVHDDEKEKPC